MLRTALAAGAFAVAVLVASAAGGTVEATTAGAAAPGKNGQAGQVKPLPKFVQKWQNERALAADLVARGKATPNAAGVVELPNGRFVKHKLEDTEQLTVVLVDYSNVKHNAIPQPDRAVDNSTYWIPDFTPQHYRDMLFSAGGASYGNPSMRDFYLELSSGKFTWQGQVSNWVTLPNTLAYYGANLRTSGAGGDDAFGPTSKVVKDTVTTLTPANAYGGIDLAKVDLSDRYDCDGDGNFEEPDGYVDHFGIAHAGQGEEAGASPDTIWSHRSYANLNFVEGPAGCQLGGYEIAGTGLWVGDYTIEPENGAVGVFAHEFGHDLGLPDLYDRVGGENSTGFWSLMSSGSWASSVPNTLDTAPTHMGAWEKLALGWLDVAAATAGDTAEFDLGPAEGDQRGNYQGLRINLEPETRTTTLFPVDGADQNYFWSDKGDDIDTNAAKTLPAPLTAATAISFRAMWNIELDWDYAYLETTSDGTTWTVGLDECVDHDEPERPELRLRDHGRVERLDDGDGDAPDRDDGVPLPLLDGRRDGGRRLRRRLDRGCRPARGERHEHGGLDAVRLPPAHRWPVHGFVLPLLPGGVAQLHRGRQVALRRLQLPRRQLAGEAVLRKGSAALVPELRVGGQRHRRAPGCRTDPPDRHPAGDDGDAGREDRVADALAGVGRSADARHAVGHALADREGQQDPDGDVHSAAGDDVPRLVDDGVLQHGAAVLIREDGRLGREARDRRRERRPDRVPRQALQVDRRAGGVGRFGRPHRSRYEALSHRGAELRAAGPLVPSVVQPPRRAATNDAERPQVRGLPNGSRRLVYARRFPRRLRQECGTAHVRCSGERTLAQATARHW